MLLPFPLRHRLLGSRAFTLVELMVVLLVVGTLVALGLAKFAPATDAVKTTRAKAEVMNALKDASAYYAVNRSYAGIDDDAAKNFSSVRASVDASSGGCDQGAMEAGASEGTVSVCVDDQDLIAVTCDHAGNAWTVVSGDGSSSGPEKNGVTSCGGIASADAWAPSDNDSRGGPWSGYRNARFEAETAAGIDLSQAAYVDLSDEGGNHVFLGVSDCDGHLPCVTGLDLWAEGMVIESGDLNGFDPVTATAYAADGHIVAKTDRVALLPGITSVDFDPDSGTFTITGHRLDIVDRVYAGQSLINGHPAAWGELYLTSGSCAAVETWGSPCHGNASFSLDGTTELSVQDDDFIVGADIPDDVHYWVTVQVGVPRGWSPYGGFRYVTAP